MDYKRIQDLLTRMLEKVKDCPLCDGAGADPTVWGPFQENDGYPICPMCKGTGGILVVSEFIDEIRGFVKEQ